MNELKEKNRKKILHDIQVRSFKLLNVIFMTGVFMFVWYNYYGDKLYMKPFWGNGYYAICGLFVFLYFMFGRIYDAFLISLNRIAEMIYSQILALVFSDGVMYVATLLLERKFPNVLPMLVCLGIQILFSILWSNVAHRWYYRSFGASKTFIIYDMREGMEDLINEYEMTSKFSVVGTCSTEEALSTGLSQLTPDIEAVYLCGVHSSDRNIILKECINKGIVVYIIPRVGDLLMSGAKKLHMFNLPILRLDRYSPVPEYLFMKRIFDVVFSVIMLIVLSPVILITAIAVKTDKGPVFYKQTRLTKDGKTFEIIKFRSMMVGAESDGVARLSTGDKDERVTKVGRVIRKLRIDEIPQFINILKGDMSVVGPRPERPEIAAQYEKELPEFSLRLQAKAGLTGYAQVYGKYNSSPYDKLQMDLMYIANPSMAEDMKICLATLKILFQESSTEGVDS